MYTNILFATDLLNEHSHLTEKAANIAKQFNAKLYLLHVIELPTSILIAQGLGFTELANPSKEDAQTVLSLIGESLQIPQEQQFVEIGSVKEHILNKARDLNCQLIIIGSHSATGLPSILGSTAHAVVNHSVCDVLTLKAD
ncbi:TPA: universal stress protein [Legionella pneumophila subsp. pneumophila]|uniref:universal stress protein n=1 Tax=Legionella sp. PATHC039 TaxID=2992042 RepID=UPI001A2D668A|nr:universal stress protein [Legionella sp. PATHC039]MCW8394988.1 universal stress protein [Legionella sp. PATHC039]HAT8858704.1 universal stress protein [Legionella pneumophila subsp. pneumophila]HAT9650837.1 universal stress protein [Legionella pneumophila subsp. pneumophila]HAT9920506.1 universal stress protein [Legionella pneumophila subsp. pneumophila]